MVQQEVVFNVKNLRISKTENIFATEGIRNVFRAVFHFLSTDWDGLVKTAVFENVDGNKEQVLLANDACDIPDSFFVKSGICYVTVMGGDFMVTNKAPVIVANAGYVTSEGDKEAVNYYEQILRYFDATNTNVKEYGELAKRYAVGLEDKEETMKDNAKYYAYLANQIVMGIPGQVEDAKIHIDQYVLEKEAELKGEDGNVIFPHFKIVPPLLMIKNNPDETQIEFRLNGSELEYKWREQ